MEKKIELETSMTPNSIKVKGAVEKLTEATVNQMAKVATDYANRGRRYERQKIKELIHAKSPMLEMKIFELIDEDKIPQ